MLRFLLPLLVASTTDDLGHIAYVIAAYNAAVARPVVGVIGRALSAVPPRLLRRVHIDVRQFGTVT
jgi:hypothetical protein